MHDRRSISGCLAGFELPKEPMPVGNALRGVPKRWEQHRGCSLQHDLSVEITLRGVPKPLKRELCRGLHSCRGYFSVAALGILLWCPYFQQYTVYAGETSTPAPAGNSGPADGVIARLVEQLDASRFADRQRASDKLAALGKSAIPALAKAAVGDSIEVTVRAIELLHGSLDSADQPTSDAARRALETVAKSDHAAAARRAQELLRVNGQQRHTRLQAGNGIFPGGVLRLNMPGLGQRRSVWNINGVKETEVVENDRKIAIHDDPRKGIRIEVTTKECGKDVTKKYEAKNAGDLKKNQPEGHRIYEQYGQENRGGMGIFQFQIPGGVPGGAVPAPPAFPALPLIPQGNPPAQPLVPEEISVRRVTMRLQNAAAYLKQLSPETLDKVSVAAKEELKKELGEIQQQAAQLQRRLQAKAETPEKPPQSVPAKALTR